MKEHFILFLKGIAMGIANVIPGVSGGTIALITEIYEDLINSLKSFDRKALSLLLSFKIQELMNYINGYFLLSVFGGSIVSVFSIANLFKYLFNYYPIIVWAFFFGLILASIYFVGKRIEQWNKITRISLIIGVISALSMNFMTPASENTNLFFVFLCGIIGISGMILPGLSGSFILILMGNYELLMVKAVADLDIILLTIFFLGSIFGLMLFSNILAWVFKNYKDTTLALLTGFIIGSLSIIWPWKEMIESNSTSLISSYKWMFPNQFNLENIISILMILIGILFVYYLEKIAVYQK